MTFPLHALSKVVVAAVFFSNGVHGSPSLQARQTTPALPVGWSSVGCYSDISSSRTLKIAAYTDVTNMTIESCTAFCTPAGYKYAGVEFARECYCDNVIESPATSISSSTCNMPCTGNSNEICGGSNAINIFESVIANWTEIGCYSDIPSSRTLKIAAFTDVTGMTIESCLEFCTPAGYSYAGVEFARECYCDNVIESPGAAIPSSNCSTPCTGNANEICGGTGAINIFQNVATPATSTTTSSPTSTTTSTTSTTTTSTTTSSTPSSTPIIKQTVGNFQYKGCYQDGVSGLPRSLVHQITISGGATAETCTAACKSAGFVIAGLEFGGECWCDSYMPYATLSPDTDCNMVCNADTTELCGAGNRLAVYVDSTAAPLNLQTCLNGVQLQSGNVPQFKFDLEGHYVPAFPGAPVSVPGLLGNLPVPVGANGLHLQELTGRSSNQPHTYTLPTETVGAPEALLVNDLQGNGLGFAIQPLPGGNQFFDVGTFDNVQTFFGYCAQPNPFTASTYIGPPILAVNNQVEVWAFCAGGTGSFGLVFQPNSTSGFCSALVLAMTPPLN